MGTRGQGLKDSRPIKGQLKDQLYVACGSAQGPAVQRGYYRARGCYLQGDLSQVVAEVTCSVVRIQTECDAQEAAGLSTDSLSQHRRHGRIDLYRRKGSLSDTAGESARRKCQPQNRRHGYLPNAQGAAVYHAQPSQKVHLTPTPLTAQPAISSSNSGMENGPWLSS